MATSVLQKQLSSDSCNTFLQADECQFKFENLAIEVNGNYLLLGQISGKIQKLVLLKNAFTVLSIGMTILGFISGLFGLVLSGACFFISRFFANWSLGDHVNNLHKRVVKYHASLEALRAESQHMRKSLEEFKLAVSAYQNQLDRHVPKDALSTVQHRNIHHTVESTRSTIAKLEELSQRKIPGRAHLQEGGTVFLIFQKTPRISFSN